MDEHGIIELSDTQPLVEVTIRLWSLDPDTCEEEIGWTWSEPPRGRDLDLFRLLRCGIDDHISHLERKPPRP